jgi:hypothetical protein
MIEILNNVYLCCEIAKSDKSGNTYNKLMRVSKKFNDWVNSHPNLRAELRDSFLKCSISSDGTQKWFYATGKCGNLVLHRLDGPAKIFSDSPAKIIKGGEEGWYENGQMHRRDGPADHLYDLKDTIFLSRDPNIASFEYDELFGWYTHGEIDYVDYISNGKLVRRVMAQDLLSEKQWQERCDRRNAKLAKKTFFENIYSLMINYLFS